MTVVPGIHLLGGLGPAAAYAIETSEGIVLVDSGLDRDARALKGELARLKLDSSQLRAILLTHVHGDHSGGAEFLRNETRAKVYAGKEDAAILRRGEPRDAFFSTFKMPLHTTHPTTVDVELAGDERLAFGDVSCHVIGAPGHTPGSTCYLVERDGLRVLLAGDVVVNLGEQPLGTYSVYLAPRYRGDAASFLTTLEKLRALPVPDLLLPGHPRGDSTPRSPRLTAERWQRMLDGGIREMRDVLGRFAADGANFLDGSPKRLLPNLYYLGDFGGMALYGLFSDGGFFLIDAPGVSGAPGGSGLSEFLKAALRQLGRAPADPTAVLLTDCGPLETAGLRELLENSHAEVVVAADGLEAVRPLCPPDTVFCRADDLQKRGWFEVFPLPLAGRGTAPVAYLLRWGEKKVLISGTVPAAVDEDVFNELFQELAQSRSNATGYMSSLRKLSNLRPGLWLPAVPVNGQNANLYDNAWQELLDANFRAVQRLLQRR